MKKRSLIAAGIALLFLFHVIAAFALGVYVGRHGLTGTELSLQAPNADRGARPQNQQDQAAPRPPNLPGEPELVGRVRTVTERRLDLASVGGPRQIALSDQTEFRDAAGVAISRDALVAGDMVAVFAHPVDGQALQADLVVILPPRQD